MTYLIKKQKRNHQAFYSQCILVILFVLLSTSACIKLQNTETKSFEKAEVYYRTGNYDKAIMGYTAFIADHPNSPMIDMAKLRIRCIQREVRAMLDRQDMPRPVYLGAALKATKKAPSTIKNSTPQSKQPKKEAP